MTEQFIEDDSTSTNGEPRNSEEHNQSVDALFTIGADDPLANYVGEGKKYKTTEDLARAIEEKDSFIEKLKEEGAGMREDLTKMQESINKATTLDEVLTKITASRDSKSNQSLSDDEVRNLVDAALEERLTKDAQQSNLTEAREALLTRFEGDKDKANEYITEKAKELNMEVKDLMSIATKSPKGFNELIGLDGTVTKGGEHSRGRSTETAFNGSSNEPQVGTKAYYDKLRRENPSEYWKPATQQRMMRDADKDIERFMGRKN